MSTFRFKQFEIQQDQCAMKVGTDGALLGAWVNTQASTQILDIGTGTGLIALMVAQRAPNAQITGIEIAPEAARQAADNVRRSPFAERVVIKEGAIQTFTDVPSESFDLIVSNPPFFSGGVLSNNQDRASVRHTVKLSHNALLRSIQLLLHPEGRFSLILPWIEGLRFQELAASYKLHLTRRCKVAPRLGANPNRLLMEFSKQTPSSIQEETLFIRAKETGEEKSEPFISLMADFYL